MCGIAGFVQSINSEPGDINAMTDAIAHRGPDGAGTWHSNFGRWRAEFGHRRLSIIDLEGGKQPMTAGPGAITYNGEIYNFRELQERLCLAGDSFTTASDTEVLLKHFARFGTDGLKAYEGMFAFAYWDQTSGTLTLARDRSGIKPLYYAATSDGGITFASELSSLLLHKGIDRQIDPNGLASFFFRDYVAPPATILRGVRKLPPGHFLQWNDGRMGEPTAFWTLERKDLIEATPEESIQQLDELLHQSVRAHLIADVPVGVFLSGGIDSSLVAAVAQQESNQRLSTFSIGFTDPDFDESTFAQQVADHIGSNHYCAKLDERCLLDSLDSALESVDEPLGDPSILPTFLVSRLAASHVKVVLGGDGGDELWAGYPTYAAHRLARWIPHRACVKPLQLASALMPVKHSYQSLGWKLKRLFLRWEDAPIRRHQHWMSAASRTELAALLHESRTPWHDLPAHCSDGWGEGIDSILAYDFTSYLPGSVLTKVDRASMRNGLEVRPPLLDNAMVEFAFSVNPRLKLRGKQTKWLLKQVAEKYLPHSIVHRKKKGFAIPLARWIAGPLNERLLEIVRRSPVWDWGLLHQSIFVDWVDQHRQRRQDVSKPLWGLLVLDHWARRSKI